jgi:LuxR family maltose regulon positive regulatory protein
MTGDRSQRDLVRGVTVPAGRPLLATRVAVAPLPGGPVVPRPRLYDLLDAGARAGVTLVTGPAGWGKTVLLSSWCRERAGTARPEAEGGIGWLSVEPADDGARLWPYLARALRPGGARAGATGWPPVVPETGGTAGGQVTPDGAVLLDGSSGADFLEHLAADLAGRPEPVTLVIDDLHRVADPAFPAGLEFLLRHAGQRLRLVVAARTGSPLALHRWRLAGELTEIRADDLALTPGETVDLLAAEDVTLPAADVARLWERAEGWPAGLRFAALALRGHPDPARFAAAFDGTYPDIADYLAHEVLAGLPGDVNDVLERLSVLDRCTPEAVEALTGRCDGARLLAEVARATGFLPAVVDDELGRGPAYRFHRMLGDLLRAGLARLPRAEVVELHRRAATWADEHDRPAEALRQALRARSWRQAADLLLNHWPELIPHCWSGAGEGGDPAPPAPPPELVDAEPDVGLAYALDRLAARDLAAAGYQLHRTAADASTRCRRIGDLLALVHGDLAGDQAAVRSRAASLLGGHGQIHAGSGSDAGESAARAITRMVHGSSLLGAGEMTAAEAELADGMVEAAAAGLRRATRACAARRALVLALWGRLGEAEELARLTRDAGHARLARALVALHRDRLDAAEVDLFAAMRSAYPEADTAIAVLAPLVRARICQDRGELADAYQAVRAGRRQLAERAGARSLPDAEPGSGPAFRLDSGRATDSELAYWYAALELDLRTAQNGRVAPGRPGPGHLEPDVAPSAGAEVLAVALARARLCAGDPRAAARVLPNWGAEPAGAWPPVVRLEAGLLEAAAARAADDHTRAARTLEHLLRLAEPDGHRRVFTRSQPPVGDLLSAHRDTGTAHWATLTELIGVDRTRPLTSAGPTADHPVLSEPLTERELTILRYLQSILSNVEIAVELSLSVNTVKTHVRNIYRKLDATRRREAVRRARELRLL